MVNASAVVGVRVVYFWYVTDSVLAFVLSIFFCESNLLTMKRRLIVDYFGRSIKKNHQDENDINETSNEQPEDETLSRSLLKT